MGTNGLPEIYAQARGPKARVQVWIFQATISAHLTTNIFHLRDLPASEGNF